MDLALTVSKAPQRDSQALVSNAAAKRNQHQQAGASGVSLPNGASRGAQAMRQNLQRDSSSSSAASHVGRMKALSRGALGSGNAMGTLQPRGAPNVQLEVARAVPAAIAAPGGGEPQLQVRRDSASSQGSNAFSDTPSTSSVLMMPIHDTKPKKMERATTWNTHVENLFRLQAAGYKDFSAYLECWTENAEAIPLWEDSGFIKSIKNNSGLFMYFRRARECDEKYLNKVKIYTY